MINPGDGGTNYYEILEVPADAPPHEIHKAYQRAKSTYTSDNPALYSMFSADEARELLRLIEEAYAILGNPGLRRSYDEARAKGEPVTAIHGALQGALASAAQQGAPQMKNEPIGQVVSAHQALPDFTPPEESGSQARISPPSHSSSHSSSVAPASTSSKSNLPPGTGRTVLSTYKIDEAFESELANAGDFDGGFLQRIRLYKNVSIDRMSEATRISRPYLMAVESNDFKSLPAAVFVRGFVVQVARILGLEEQKVAASYMKMFKAGGGK